MPHDRETPGDAGAGRTAEDAPLRCFSYLTAEKAGQYRRIMGTFARAKARFVLHLRPTEIAQDLGEPPEPQEPPETPAEQHSHSSAPDAVELERALDQLCDWGNLQKHIDTADVATVEQFNRPRFLYQITHTGEAVERALAVFHESIAQPGELQTAALQDIRDHLSELASLAEQEDPDAAKAWTTLQGLGHRFEQLTARAQTFIASIQRPVELQAADLATFIAYKHMLIDYLERFIGELVVRTAQIVRAIELVETRGIQGLLQRASDRDLIDAVSTTDEDRAASLDRWHQRWRGLRGWFIGEGAARSQAEELRAHARSAIPALLRTVTAIHDRRLQRSDRVADLRTLARWFAQTDSDAQAHRLWRAAFALAPTRHLRVNDQTLDQWDQDPVAPTTTWYDAPALRVSPRLRRTGRHARRGRPNAVIDRSAEKARLARRALLEAHQIAEAQRQLATEGPILLSDIARLDTAAFELFLELLGEALARKRDPAQVVEAASIDGATHVRLEPAPGAGEAHIQTPSGSFHGPDHLVWITTPRKFPRNVPRKFPRDIRQSTANRAPAAIAPVPHEPPVVETSVS